MPPLDGRVVRLVDEVPRMADVHIEDVGTVGNAKEA